MDGFISFIVIVIVLANIFKRAKKVKNSNQQQENTPGMTGSGTPYGGAYNGAQQINNRNVQVRNAMANTAPRTPNGNPVRPASQTVEANNASSVSRPASNAAISSTTNVKANTSKNMGGAVYNGATGTPNNAVDGKLSTVEYLRKKAEEDQKEHAKEHIAEERRRRTESSVPCAGRYTGFEQVRPDHKIVKCDYCWAENMVPKIRGQKYRCYFCREELKY